MTDKVQENKGKTFEVSLGKAQKWQEQLKAAGAPTVGEDDYLYRRVRGGGKGATIPAAGVLDIRVTPGMGDKSMAGIKRQAAVLLASRERMERLIEDMGKVKEAIFTGNQTSGASRTMSQMSYLKARITGLEATLRQVEGAGAGAIALGDLDEERIDALVKTAKKRDDGQVDLQVLLVDSGAVKSELQKTRSELNALDDKLREVNATHKIQVVLSKAACEVVGA